MKAIVRGFGRDRLKNLESKEAKLSEQANNNNARVAGNNACSNSNNNNVNNGNRFRAVFRP